MKERIIVVPMGDNTRKIIEMYAGAMIRAGVELAEAAEAINAAIQKIFTEAADQFEAFDAALKVMTALQPLEPLAPEKQVKATRPHPCPDAGRRRRPENVRIPQTIQRARIRPQARSTIKQRRNRRRE